MSIIESTATALVRFTGLGIIVFNEQKKRGEIAIIRDDKHELSIKIQQPRFKDGVDKDVVVYEDIGSYTDLQKSDVTIEILTKGNSALNGYQTYQAEGDFNRLESNDANDFRWIVSMKNLHQENVVKAPGANRYPISKLYIENGLFYVHKLDTNLFFEKIEKDASGNETARETFGNVAETVGVKLDADEVVFNIKIGEKEDSHSLSRGNLPYRIEIKNMNYDEDAVMSDMPDYYKYIGGQDEVKYEFSLITDGESVGGGVNGRTFCHLIEGGGDFSSIDDLV